MIFEAAVAVAREFGYRNITRKRIAVQLTKTEGWTLAFDQTENYLANRTSMTEVIDQIMAEKDRLALVPGERQATLSNLWKRYDQADIIERAYRLSVRKGLLSFSLPQLANETGFARTTLRNYFGGIEGVREAVVRKAIEHKNAQLVLEGLAAHVRAALEAPEELRQAASAKLLAS